jgi:DNA-binding NarL/FixJ family response regulator
MVLLADDALMEMLWKFRGNGVVAWLPMTVSASEFISTIRKGAIGGCHVARVHQGGVICGDSFRRLERLTERQREVLAMICGGANVKQIGEALGISPKTVESHRAGLMERLEIYHVAGLVRFAIKVGLINVD